MSENQTPTSPATELVAVVEDLVERQRQILGALVATTHPLKNDVQAVLLGLRGVVTKLRNGAAGVTTTAAPSIENAELRDLIADELGRHLPSATTGAEANVHEALYFGLVSVVAPVLEGLRAELDEAQSLCETEANHRGILADTLEQERKAYDELLASIWLYVDWRYVTKQLTAEQKELWATAVDAGGDPDDRHPKADRWWRDARPSVSDQTPQPISLPRAHQIAQEIAKEAEARRSALAEREAASDQTPATDPACDPVGTVRDLGNRTSFPEDNPLAHINRYWIKWAPPHDLDEDRPWVAINHEADLQRMPNDLMAAYPVVPLAELAARLRHAAPSSVQGDTTPEEA